MVVLFDNMMSSKSTFLGLTSIGAVGLVAVMRYAWTAAVRIHTPYPSASELALEGGMYFTRPSDGRNMEYFIINPKGRHIVIWSHGSSSTGRSGLAMMQRGVMDRLNVCVLCPSAPGYGATEAYAAAVQDSTERALRAYGDDVLALVSSVSGVKDCQVGCTGISMGSEFAFAVAGAAARSNRLRFVASVVGIVFPNVEFTGHAETVGFVMRTMSRLMTVEWVLRTLAALVFPPMLASVTTKQLSKTPGFGRFNKEQLEGIVADLKRFGRHTYLGMLGALRWTSHSQRVNPVPDYYMEVAKSKRPVHVHYGTQDKSATIENQYFIVKHVPQSELISFEGGHGDFDMNAILQRAMRNAA